MVKKNACVFISGEGSNLKNLLKRSRDYNFPISIKLVVSNNPRARGVNFAKKHSIPCIIVNTRFRFFESVILNNLNKYRISIICLAGYMKIISKNFLRSFKKQVINIHPSLLPKFKELNTFERILKKKEKNWMHCDEIKTRWRKNYCSKKFLYYAKFKCVRFKERTQKLEYSAYPEALIKIFRASY